MVPPLPCFFPFSNGKAQLLPTGKERNGEPVYVGQHQEPYNKSKLPDASTNVKVRTKLEKMRSMTSTAESYKLLNDY